MLVGFPSVPPSLAGGAVDPANWAQGANLTLSEHTQFQGNTILTGAISDELIQTIVGALIPVLVPASKRAIAQLFGNATLFLDDALRKVPGATDAAISPMTLKFREQGLMPAAKSASSLLFVNVNTTLGTLPQVADDTVSPLIRSSVRMQHILLSRIFSLTLQGQFFTRGPSHRRAGSFYSGHHLAARGWRKS